MEYVLHSIDLETYEVNELLEVLYAAEQNAYTLSQILDGCAETRSVYRKDFAKAKKIRLRILSKRRLQKILGGTL